MSLLYIISQTCQPRYDGGSITTPLTTCEIYHYTGGVKQTLAPAANLVLGGFGCYFACERVIAIMPLVIHGEYDPTIHGAVRHPSYAARGLLRAQKKTGGKIIDFTRKQKALSIILMDDGSIIRSPFHSPTLVERIEEKRTTGNLVVRKDKGKPRKFGGKPESE
jgi:regulator of extracellular matrix RemA (YlzA/DUF370 family)